MPALFTDRFRPVRFVINGLAAAAVHFCVLAACLEWLQLGLAALANVIAAVAGIAVSFAGNRHFVFMETAERWHRQLVRFGVLYISLTVLHGLTLLLWTDIAGFAYPTGFVLGAAIAALFTYLGGKYWVFRPLEANSPNHGTQREHDDGIHEHLSTLPAAGHRRSGGIDR